MSWIKIDDLFSDHPKVMNVGPLASWLYVCGLCYAGRYLTDGFIPQNQLRKLADIDDPLLLAMKLCEVHLWERVEDGYKIHDWQQYNPPAAKVKEQREKNAKRQAEWKARQRDDDPDETDEETEEKQDGNGVSDGVSNGVNNSAPSPSPSPSLDPDPKSSTTIVVEETAASEGVVESVLIETKKAALTEGQEFYKTTFKRKTFKTAAQLDALARIETDVGIETFKKAVEWAAVKGVADIHAIESAARTMKKNQGTRKDNRNGRSSAQPIRPENENGAGTDYLGKHANLVRSAGV